MTINSVSFCMNANRMKGEGKNSVLKSVWLWAYGKVLLRLHDFEIQSVDQLCCSETMYCLVILKAMRRQALHWHSKTGEHWENQPARLSIWSLSSCTEHSHQIQTISPVYAATHTEQMLWRNRINSKSESRFKSQFCHYWLYDLELKFKTLLP